MTLNINSNKRKNYGEIEQVQPYIKQNKMTPDRVAETLASSNSIDYTPERMIRLVSSNDRSNSDVKAVLAFLSQKGTPSQKKKLFVDCINKNYKTIALELLSKGIVSPESENDETLLELAEEYGCLKLIKYCWPFLFKKKSGQSFEETVLSLAISKGNIKIANKLLDLFDIHSGSGFKLFRVLISVKNSNLENFLNIENIRDKILKGVKSFPRYVRARFVKEAITEGRISFAKLLIENNLGKDVLFSVIDEKNLQLLDKLIDLFNVTGKKVDFCDKNKITPFFYAVKCAWLEGMKVLAVKGKAKLGKSPSSTILSGFCSTFDSEITFKVIKQLLELATPESPVDLEYYLPCLKKFNSNQLYELERIAPFRHSYNAIIAGHVWGLSGYVVTGQLKTNLEGACYPANLALAIFDDFRKFINIRSAVKQIDLKNQKQFLENLNHFIKPISAKAIDALQTIQQGRPVCLMMDSSDHVFYVVISGDRFYLCNRGYSNDREIANGVYDMAIEDPQKNIPMFLTDVDAFQESEDIFSICYGFIDFSNDLDILNDFSIVRSTQKNNNCSTASFKMALLALLVDETRDQDQALKIYKDFTSYLRKRWLDKLLAQPIEYVRDPLQQIRKKLTNPSAKK